MYVINTPEVIQSVPWPEIRQLIQIRMLQNDINQDHGYLISCFIVVGINDSAHGVKQEICNQLRQIKTDPPIDEIFTPSHEWVLTHPTCYEVAYIHCDREFGVCLLIPKVSGIDSDLLELGACYGEPVPDAAA